MFHSVYTYAYMYSLGYLHVYIYIYTHTIYMHLHLQDNTLEATMQYTCTRMFPGSYDSWLALPLTRRPTSQNAKSSQTQRAAPIGKADVWRSAYHHLVACGQHLRISRYTEFHTKTMQIQRFRRVSWRTASYLPRVGPRGYATNRPVALQMIYNTFSLTTTWAGRGLQGAAQRSGERGT